MDIKKIWTEFSKDGKKKNFDTSLRRLKGEATSHLLDLEEKVETAKESLETAIASSCGQRGAFGSIVGFQVQLSEAEADYKAASDTNTVLFGK